jgi:chemotaxis family two-component system sensor kinase Cph1
MSNFQVDLTNCDIEPIHIPGQLQSHGFLIVLDQENIIRYYSDNITGFIDQISTELLGQSLKYVESFFGLDYKPDLIGRLIDSGRQKKSFKRINPVSITISNIPYNLIISESADYYLLEFELAGSSFDVEVSDMIGHSISEMLTHKDMTDLLANAAIEVKDIIQYDRVMIYRFAEDGHGEVVAESKNPDLETWLGLHYPASDIPKQARELYKLNLTRLIADVQTTPSKITTAAGNDQPLNLTWSQLRAVSPIHIQYLKNMGVASSFSISIICKNELWGLIACHSYTPQFIDYKSREYAKLIGQILSSALEYREDEGNQQIQDDFKENLAKIEKSFQENQSITDALVGNPLYLLNTVHAQGAILIHERHTTKLGIIPGDKYLPGLISWIKENVTEPIYHTENLSAVFPEAAAYQDIASGMMVCTLSQELEEYVIWFKPEQIYMVKWAGNPDKPVEETANGLMQISPRHSFEVWSQTVAGRSEKWSIEEIKSVTRFKEEITYSINLKAGAIRLLNERLRHAYEELETFSYTISHDLKSPIASIKSYAQLLIRDQSLHERGLKMLERIADRADQMNLMINAVLDYSRIGKSEFQYRKIHTGALIGDIIKDLDLVYDTSKLQITVGDTPDLSGDPIMMLQVFSNLIGNAVKYSQYSSPAKVHIEGEQSETGICYTIKDNGLGIAVKDQPNIFELFHRMDNVKDIEGSGVGLAIVKRIVEKHKGRIWAESELNQGSTFFVAFNN